MLSLASPTQQITDDEVRHMFDTIGTVVRVDRTHDPMDPHAPSVVCMMGLSQHGV